MQRTIIGVIGAGNATPEGEQQAYAVGRALAERGAVLVCGGLGGVMAAASRGCHEAGGLVLGLLPGDEPGSANPYVHLPVPTNLGHARNVLIAHTARALIAVEGEYGTLSEIAFGLKLGKPVFGLHSWDISGVIAVASAEEAVCRALAALEGR